MQIACVSHLGSKLAKNNTLCVTVEIFLYFEVELVSVISITWMFWIRTLNLFVLNGIFPAFKVCKNFYKDNNLRYAFKKPILLKYVPSITWDGSFYLYFIFNSLRLFTFSPASYFIISILSIDSFEHMVLETESRNRRLYQKN